MGEYKKADEIVKNMTEKFDKNYGDTTIKGIRDVFNMCVNCVNQTPTADAVEVKHGKWKRKGQDIYCSVCGNESAYNPFGASKFSDHCPNCGAKMDGKE